MMRKPNQGFTLLELMIVVSIVAILLSLARPGLGNWRASSRQYDTAMSIANMARRAASRARQTGMAHRLKLTTVNGDEFEIAMHQGMGRRCRQTSWENATIHPPIEIDAVTYDMLSVPGAVAKLSVQFQAFGSPTIVNEKIECAPMALVSSMSVCYQPNGNTYTSPNSVTMNFVRQICPLEVRITRTGGSSRDRVVTLPASGTPRSRL